MRVCGVFDWAEPARAVTGDEAGSLVFPPVPGGPAIYRLAFQRADNHTIYVGETDNMRRRMGSRAWSRPVPSSPTANSALCSTRAVEALQRPVVRPRARRAAHRARRDPARLAAELTRPLPSEGVI